MDSHIKARRGDAQVDGLLLLDKPAGMTSNRALQTVKRLLRARKAGHTGSLDPAATGMLPLCFGEATKICAYLLESDKTYRVTARLGQATDTGDADGRPSETAPVPLLSREDWESVVASFVGESKQVPPMYSALRQDGKRLYELARQGRTVDRKARPIFVHEIELMEASGQRLVLRVHCSKGTYIRTLIEDIARKAGTVAHVASLHRESVGDFRGSDMLGLEAAERLAASGPEALRERLMPADRALVAWPERRLPTAAVDRFVSGQPVGLDQPEGLGTDALIRVYSEDNLFVGVGVPTGDGRLAPRRIFHTVR